MTHTPTVSPSEELARPSDAQLLLLGTHAQLDLALDASLSDWLRHATRLRDKLTRMIDRLPSDGNVFARLPDSIGADAIALDRYEAQARAVASLTETFNRLEPEW